MKIEIDLNQKEKRTMCAYSIERTFNSTKNILIDQIEKDAVAINLGNIEEIEPIIYKIWNAIRQEAFEEMRRKNENT